MTAEPLSASLVSRLSVSNKPELPKGYYRSKLFIATSAANPLVAAAGPLLSLLERLCVSPTLPPIQDIRDNIEHELYAFQSRLLGQNYSEEFVIIAQYLLSATIDELLGKNYIRLYDKTAEFKAFTPATQDGIEPQQRFFELLNHMKERASQYIDLLELSYYCLIAGFEGEQHLRPNGRQILDELIEELYRLIQQHRVHKPHKLFSEHATPTSTKPNIKPLILGVLIAVGMVTAIYLTSHLWLEYKAKTVLHNHSLLARTDS